MVQNIGIIIIVGALIIAAIFSDQLNLILRRVTLLVIIGIFTGLFCGIFVMVIIRGVLGKTAGALVGVFVGLAVTAQVILNRARVNLPL